MTLEATQRREHVHLEAGVISLPCDQACQSCDRRPQCGGEKWRVKGVSGGGEWRHQPGSRSHLVSMGNSREGISPGGQKDYHSEVQVRRTPQDEQRFQASGYSNFVDGWSEPESCFYFWDMLHWSIQWNQCPRKCQLPLTTHLWLVMNWIDYRAPKHFKACLGVLIGMQGKVSHKHLGTEGSFPTHLGIAFRLSFSSLFPLLELHYKYAQILTLEYVAIFSCHFFPPVVLVWVIVMSWKVGRQFPYLWNGDT